MWLIVLLVFLDQVSKYFLTTVINTGAAFGVLKGYNTLLLIINLIALGVCIFFYLKDKGLKIPLMLVISGIIGNSIDRIVLGHVRDFIDIGILNFPVFNLADIYNVIGIALLMIRLWKK